MSGVPANGRYNVWAGNPKGRARDESRCWEEVMEGGRGGLHYQCGRRWTVERDGKRYCAQHDPEAVAVKARAREERYQAKQREWDRNFARKAAERAVVQAALGWYTSAGNQQRTTALEQACAALIDVDATPPPSNP